MSAIDPMLESRKQLGFTLIELLLVIAIIGVIASLAMVGQRHQKSLQRDVKRVSHISEIQKALALYFADEQQYPTYTGCIDGSDPVTSALIGNKLFGSSSGLIDPSDPTDVATCYYYEGISGAYTLRYTLERNSSAGSLGDHLIVP